MSPRIRMSIAAALFALAVVALVLQRLTPAPTPAPPAPDAAIKLRGLYIGEQAADDALLMASLLDELAAVIEWDGQQTEPRLKTGIAFDDLRVAAREMRCRGDSIGARQPKVRAAVDAYLTSVLGTSGGPVGPEQRSAWVAAFREVSRAAEAAAR